MWLGGDEVAQPRQRPDLADPLAKASYSAFVEKNLSIFPETGVFQHNRPSAIIAQSLIAHHQFDLAFQFNHLVNAQQMSW